MWAFIKTIFVNVKKRELNLDLDNLELNSNLRSKFVETQNEAFASLLEEIQQKRLSKLYTLKSYSCFASLVSILLFFVLQKYVGLNISGRYSSLYSVLFCLLLVVLATLLIRKTITHFSNYHNFIKSNLLQTSLRFFGDFTYQPHSDDNKKHLDFKSDNILPEGDFSQVSNLINGNYKGSNVTIFDIAFYRKLSGEKKFISSDAKLINQGVIVEIELAKSLAEQVVIKRDYVFDVSYLTQQNKIKDVEVYSNNAKVSDAVLDQEFIKSLLLLTAEQKGFLCKFAQNKFFLFIELDKSFFEQKSLITKKDLKIYLKNIISRLDNIIDLANIIEANQKIIT